MNKEKSITIVVKVLVLVILMLGIVSPAPAQECTNQVWLEFAEEPDLTEGDLVTVFVAGDICEPTLLMGWQMRYDPEIVTPLERGTDIPAYALVTGGLFDGAQSFVNQQSTVEGAGQAIDVIYAFTGTQAQGKTGRGNLADVVFRLDDPHNTTISLERMRLLAFAEDGETPIDLAVDVTNGVLHLTPDQMAPQATPLPTPGGVQDDTTEPPITNQAVKLSDARIVLIAIAILAAGIGVSAVLMRKRSHARRHGTRV